MLTRRVPPRLCDSAVKICAGGATNYFTCGEWAATQYFFYRGETETRRQLTN